MTHYSLLQMPIAHCPLLGYTRHQTNFAEVRLNTGDRDVELVVADERLRTIQEIGRAVASTLDLGTLYDTIFEQVSRVMDTRIFFLALHRSARGTVELAYHREAGELLPP